MALGARLSEAGAFVILCFAFRLSVFFVDTQMPLKWL
jgi:hypothetical protein